MPKDKFPVMLVSPMKEINRIVFPCIAQTKMDGMRALIVVENKKITVFSRNGKPMIKLDKHFESMIFHDNIVYDGELTVLDNDGKVMNRQTGNGICHKAVVGTISDEEVKNIRITLWDIISLDSWKNGVDPTPYHLRLGELNSIPKSELHTIVRTFIVDDLEHAKNLFNDLVRMGEEGLILKQDDHPWENKRSKYCVKMKNEIERDMKIVGFTEGEGKNAKMCGAIQCENHDGNIKVSVGTGMDDNMRKYLWKHQKELLGKIVAVKFNDGIKSKGKKAESLFLPVFVELRPDKDVAD